jgi:hypothetical protein
MFGSSSLKIHLLRGLAAAVLIALGITAHSAWLTILCFIGALFLLGGCPMCWTMGLIRTLKKDSY